MAIAPVLINGQPVLRLAIAESKFIGIDNAKAMMNKSKAQLLETTLRIVQGLQAHESSPSRTAWLQRLGNLMLEAMEPFREDPVNGWDLVTWSREVAAGRVPIEVIGLSMVFVHDTAEAVDQEPTPVGKYAFCHQEVSCSRNIISQIQAFTKGEHHGALSWRALSPFSSVTPESERYSNQEATGIDSLARPISHQPFNLTVVNDEAQPSEESHQRVSPVQLEATSQSSTKSESGENTSEGRLEGDVGQREVGLREQLRSVFVGLEGEISPESEADRSWLQESTVRLRKALLNYDMHGEILGSRLTPNAGLVRLKGSDNLTVGKLERRRQELYTSHAIEICGIEPGPGEIRIMIKRPRRATLKLGELWASRKFSPSYPESNLLFLLGAKELDGELLYLNLDEEVEDPVMHGPHTLIAGETGSGKGVLTQTLLLDICATNSVESVQVRVIDPKAGVDYPWLRALPHLRGGIVTSQDEAITVLNELVVEMEERYRLFAAKGVNKLRLYNEEVAGTERLPVIFLFHDEFADWMLIDEYRKVAETNVNRLGAKARAAGIHLVFITQRPDKDAFPMQLRANLSNRLILKVADKANSELVLNQAGAEALLGRGHLLAKLAGEPTPYYAQVPFMRDKELSQAAKAVGEVRNMSQ